MSILTHANISVNLADTVSAQANFGTGIIVDTHTITANRQDGPYSSVADVVDAGFTLAAAPTIYNAASIFFSQRPRSSQVYIGRRASAELMVTALDAIEAVDPSTFYCLMPQSNTTDDLMAVAAWTESRSKISILQSSSSAALAGTASTAQVTTLQFGGTPADGDYVVTITNTWTGAVVSTTTITRSGGTPATNSDLGAQLRTDIAADLGATAVVTGATDSAILTFASLGQGYTVTTSAPGAATFTATTPAFTQNPAELLAALAYDRSALLYHDDDAEYLNVAWAARCLGFNLDAPAGAGTWANHRLTGVTATALTTAQKTQLRNAYCNYYSPIRFTSGTLDPGIVFPGVMTSGQFIDLTTTIDITRARIEEAILNAFVSVSSTSRPKIPYTDAGTAMLQAAVMGVLNRLGRAGHFNVGAESSATGRITPYVDVDPVSQISTADKTARRLVMQGEVVASGAIHSVGDNSTIGLTIDVGFG